MKERLDVLLVKRNLAESREKAKAVIMDSIKVTKKVGAESERVAY